MKKNIVDEREVLKMDETGVDQYFDFDKDGYTNYFELFKNNALAILSIAVIIFLSNLGGSSSDFRQELIDNYDIDPIFFYNMMWTNYDFTECISDPIAREEMALTKISVPYESMDISVLSELLPNISEEEIRSGMRMAMTKQNVDGDNILRVLLNSKVYFFKIVVSTDRETILSAETIFTSEYELLTDLVKDGYMSIYNGILYSVVPGEVTGQLRFLAIDTESSQIIVNRVLTLNPDFTFERLSVFPNAIIFYPPYDYQSSYQSNTIINLNGFAAEIPSSSYLIPAEIFGYYVLRSGSGFSDSRYQMSILNENFEVVHIFERNSYIYSVGRLLVETRAESDDIVVYTIVDGKVNYLYTTEGNPSFQPTGGLNGMPGTLPLLYAPNKSIGYGWDGVSEVKLLTPEGAVALPKPESPENCTIES